MELRSGWIASTECCLSMLQAQTSLKGDKEETHTQTTEVLFIGRMRGSRSKWPAHVEAAPEVTQDSSQRGKKEPAQRKCSHSNQPSQNGRTRAGAAAEAPQTAVLARATAMPRPWNAYDRERWQRYIWCGASVNGCLHRQDMAEANATFAIPR